MDKTISLWLLGYLAAVTFKDLRNQNHKSEEKVTKEALDLHPNRVRYTRRVCS